ncbi:Histidine kinase domain-containing protein [Sulfidibacter corallicola]|uniref:histidine kinase n=1 Tax=Sulfidibacter corallicola TaxID=2818388 RepID=A0A8A4TZK7_SULCO|nr:ATP-binding protein [Sulfidibacter corallicola]QTD54362.1 hypothetical protein J3U87_18100 [Sulfidibacter corallicola]
MTRGIIFAILTFGLLIIANLAVFGFLTFSSLSEAIVTERLVAGIREAETLLQEQLVREFPDRSPDGRSLSRRIAPRLRKFSFFHSVVVLDRQGRVLHREMIRGSMVVRANESREQPPESPHEHHADQMARMIPVQSGTSPLSDDNRLALEYNPNLIEQEVAALRTDLNRKLTFAIIISLALLCLGLVYVIWAYRRNKELQEHARKADQMAYVGTLASGLAHEIRNPLNSMNMNVQLIQEELEDRGADELEDLQDMLMGTRKEIMRLERLVGSFLSYARPTALQSHPCDLNALIQAVLTFLDPEIKKSGVRLEILFDEHLPQIQADEAQMRQALLNVVQNAIQILTPGKLLEIKTATTGNGKVMIQIRDEGPGISDPELKNIFKVFYSTRIGGTGLGLPIAQRIAEAHQGRIDVSSRIGEGTVFTFTLPQEQKAA